MKRTLIAVVIAMLATMGGSGTPMSSTPAGAQPVAPLPTKTPAGPAVASAVGSQELPGGCVEPNRHLTLYAVELPAVDGQIRLGYGVTPATAAYPGPTIEMIEGECLAVTVVNNVPASTLAALRDHPTLGLVEPDPSYPLGVSLHVHGVKYTSASDGTMHSGSWVPPGGSRTYVWYAEPRAVTADGRVLSHGTAGYWWYHDHVVGTDHGTGGIGSGLFGALVVRRAGDPLPDFTYVLAMGDDATINLDRYPDTDTCDPASARPGNTCLVAREGDLVEFVVFGIGNDFHTFHLHGHTWVDDRTGVLTPTGAETRVVDVIPLGPSASFGFQITAGASVGSGDWMIHCHVQRHSDLGMSTFLHVVPEGAELAAPGLLDSPPDSLPDAQSSTHSGARFRGAARPSPVSSSDPARTLGYYCSLPLAPWAAAVAAPASARTSQQPLRPPPGPSSMLALAPQSATSAPAAGTGNGQAVTPTGQ